MATDNTKAVKELLEIIKNKVDKIELRQSSQSSQINLVREQQSVINEKLDEVTETQEDHTRKLEAVSGDVEQLLLDVKGIRDDIGLKHQRDKREIDEIKTHLGLPLMPDISEL